MRDIILDGSDWNANDDIYDAFFDAVGAPSWHGRNFDALNDSIANGEINEIELPYRLVIINGDRIGPQAKQMVNDFVDLIKDIAKRGYPVEIQIYPGVKP